MDKTSNNFEQYRPKSEEFPFRKQLILFGVGWLGFQIIGSLISIAVTLCFLASNPGMTSELVSENIVFKTIVNSVVYAVILAAMLIISNVDLKRFKNSITNYQSYIAGIIGFVVLFGFTIIYSYFIELLNINIGDNLNEQTVRKAIDAFPIISFFVIGIFAPICEELTYRVGLFGLLSRKNKVMAYCVATLVFALIHFTLDIDTIVNELLNFPYYLFAGLVLTYLYDRYGFAASATAHILNNSWSQISRLFR